MKLWKTIILSLLIVLTSCTESKQVDGPEIQSIDYINKENLGNNLSTLAKKVSRATETYRIIESKLGTSEANRVVDSELEKTIGKYQGEWNKNLAQSFSEVLSLEEINSLYYNGKNSPYFKKRMSLQRVIGSSMQRKSRALLEKVVSEAMQSAFKNVSA